MNDRERHQRATEIFVEAVDFPDAQRDAHIKEACAGDPVLEAEVLSLFRYDLPEPQDPAEVPVLAAAPPEDMAGRTVGRFRIVSAVGQGGMGRVWKAEDPLLRRVVAIKFLPEAQRRSEVARVRFLREARAMADVSHPGIAAVFDAGEADGELYIAMQFVDGQTVRERVRNGPLAPRDAVSTCLHAARALAHAHAMGLVHRDVTSSNIMIRDNGDIIVVDFGLARRSIDSTRLSRTGQLVGTVGYIAPEVIQGDDATPGSDVFSLGGVLYEMLCGHLPFEDPKPLNVLQATLDCEAETLSHFVDHIPRELDHIVGKALARDARARYASAAQLADDLEALLETGELSQEPGHVSRPPRWTRPNRRLTHKRRMAYLLILAVAAAAVVAVLLLKGLSD